MKSGVFGKQPRREGCWLWDRPLIARIFQGLSLPPPGWVGAYPRQSPLKTPIGQRLGGGESRGTPSNWPLSAVGQLCLALGLQLQEDRSKDGCGSHGNPITATSQIGHREDWHLLQREGPAKLRHLLTRGPLPDGSPLSTGWAGITFCSKPKGCVCVSLSAARKPRRAEGSRSDLEVSCTWQQRLPPPNFPSGEQMDGGWELPSSPWISRDIFPIANYSPCCTILRQPCQVNAIHTSVFSTCYHTHFNRRDQPQEHEGSSSSSRRHWLDFKSFADVSNQT